MTQAFPAVVGDYYCSGFRAILPEQAGSCMLHFVGALILVFMPLRRPLVDFI